MCGFPLSLIADGDPVGSEGTTIRHCSLTQ